jgi:hypothetical protein
MPTIEFTDTTKELIHDRATVLARPISRVLTRAPLAARTPPSIQFSQPWYRCIADHRIAHWVAKLHAARERLLRAIDLNGRMLTIRILTIEPSAEVRAEVSAAPGLVRDLIRRTRHPVLPSPLGVPGNRVPPHGVPFGRGPVDRVPFGRGIFDGGFLGGIPFTQVPLIHVAPNHVSPNHAPLSQAPLDHRPLVSHSGEG